MDFTAYNDVLSLDLIQKRIKITMCLSSSWCVMCKSNNESIEHLFIQCPTTQYLWNKADITQGLQSITAPPNNLSNNPSTK